MTVKHAECHIEAVPGLTAKPTRVRNAEVRMTVRAEVPVSASALGGQEFTIRIVGKRAPEVIQLLSALREPDAPKREILARLRELSGNSESAP